MFAIYRGDEYIIAVSDKPAAVKGKYVVQKGDSLSRIAGKAGITLNKLMTANPQIKNANLIVPGQQINLP
ncbi:MAG: LysM peptidoglycan-binding domain-containing protein [Lachnoclostridium sp.]|nr:LysM peptidoglycan-binding domain-containing protein [Lachnospiraceae bacterium]MCM1249487.1 LysM peptidoglycan-binding domain-containing protein [Lachnoclostridium sp.]MCM1536523.1 LysM peptidoglycan-binding domain-containing protein [Clostridium sp.]